jgi:TonB family protein
MADFKPKVDLESGPARAPGAGHSQTMRIPPRLIHHGPVIPPAPLMGPLIFFSLALHGFLIALMIVWPALFHARAAPLSIMHVHTISLPKRLGEINPGGNPSHAPATPDTGAKKIAAPPPPAPASAPAIRPSVAASAAAALKPKSAAAAAPVSAPGTKGGKTAGSEGKPGSAPGTGGWGGGKGLASGGGAGVAFDEDFAQTWYQAAIERKIKAAWQKPPTQGSKNFVVKIHFVIHDGRADWVEIAQKSGDPAFDLSAQQAVINAQPMPPIPPAAGKDRLGVTFEFHSKE